MTARLHPQDLRAIVAALQMQDPEANVKTAVRLTDDLLAELERSAKPEPKTDALACGHGSWSIQENGDMACLLCGTEWVTRPEFVPDLAAIRADAYRMGFSDAQEGKVTPPMPFDHEVESRRALWERAEAAEADGAREERERIIALFDRSRQRLAPQVQA